MNRYTFIYLASKVNSKDRRNYELFCPLVSVSDVLSTKFYFVTFTRYDLKKMCMGHRVCGFVTNPVTNIFENVADSKRTKSHILLNISSSISMNGGVRYG